jgi:hypothetical protein
MVEERKRRGVLGLKIDSVESMSDDRLEKLEGSRTYLAVDIIFNWIGGLGLILLLAYSIRWWHRDSAGLGFDPKFWFWLKVLLLGLVLISVTWIKDHVPARIDIAPPDYGKWLGKKQSEVGSPEMRLILDAQQRAARIRERGIQVDKLLAENEAIFLRKQKNLNR